MLENDKGLDHVTHLFWTVNSLSLCPLFLPPLPFLKKWNICLIICQELILHFFLCVCEKSSFFVSEIIQYSVSWPHHLSQLQQIIFSL